MNKKSKYNQNIIIINIKDSKHMKKILKQLEALDKITKVILLKNSYLEFFFEVLYRILIYPLKLLFFKRDTYIKIYYDGCVGRIPIKIANFGKIDEVIFYEEGESIYIENIFKTRKIIGIKNKIREKIKLILKVPEFSLNSITFFYVRNKQKFEKIFLNEKNKINFKVVEVNEVKKLNKLSNEDKQKLKKIFLDKVNIKKTEKKKIVILTQPLYLDRNFSKEETKKLFDKCIENINRQKYEVYLKLHPKDEDIYIKTVPRIEGNFPFELLSILNIKFDIGITFDSTSINSAIIKKRVLLKNRIY